MRSIRYTVTRRSAEFRHPARMTQDSSCWVGENDCFIWAGNLHPQVPKFSVITGNFRRIRIPHGEFFQWNLSPFLPFRNPEFSGNNGVSPLFDARISGIFRYHRGVLSLPQPGNFRQLPSFYLLISGIFRIHSPDSFLPNSAVFRIPGRHIASQGDYFNVEILQFFPLF